MTKNQRNFPIKPLILMFVFASFLGGLVASPIGAEPRSSSVRSKILCILGLSRLQVKADVGDQVDETIQSEYFLSELRGLLSLDRDNRRLTPADIEPIVDLALKNGDLIFKIHSQVDRGLFSSGVSELHRARDFLISFAEQGVHFEGIDLAQYGSRVTKAAWIYSGIKMPSSEPVKEFGQ